MLRRLRTQIKSNGVIFLVLPMRCVASKHVGEARFEDLLRGLGLRQLIATRHTPKLVFYVLGLSDEGMRVSRIDIALYKCSVFDNIVE